MTDTYFINAVHKFRENNTTGNLMQDIINSFIGLQPIKSGDIEITEVNGKVVLYYKGDTYIVMNSLERELYFRLLDLDNGIIPKIPFDIINRILLILGKDDIIMNTDEVYFRYSTTNINPSIWTDVKL